MATKCASTLLAPHFKLKAIMSPTAVEEREYIYLTYLMLAQLVV